MVVRRELEFSFCFYYITIFNLKYVAISDAYYMVPLVIMVPSEISLTTLQRLCVPFSLRLWIAWIIVIVFALIVITLIELTIYECEGFYYRKQCAVHVM